MSELNHLGAVIRLFDPGADVEAIAPIRPLVNRRARNGGMWTCGRAWRWMCCARPTSP